MRADDCRPPLIGLALVILFGCDSESDHSAIAEDELTGLKWIKDSPGGFDWQDANTYCNELTIEDDSDWRLPTLLELEGIDSHAVTIFTDIEKESFYTAVYWSNTPQDRREPSEFFFTWDFDNHHPQAYYKTKRKQVTCVHAPPPRHSETAETGPLEP